MQQLHRDPVYWGETVNDFRPERFLADPVTGEMPVISPLVYKLFGARPRICIGQRFAITNLKLARASMWVHFRFLP